MENKIQNQVQTTGTPARKSLQDYIKVMEPEIKKALPSVITPERFTRITLSAISSNPKLAACTPQSFLAAMMQAAQLGLEPNTNLGQAYLIPYKNKGVDEVQFQVGYKGLIDLAYRSGRVDSIQCHIVYANDVFEYEFGLEPKLRHVPAAEKRGDAVKVYAVFKTKDGGYGFDVMTLDECRAHAMKYSKAAGSDFSPWKTNFEEMCKKTVLKRVLKYAPLSTEFVRAVASDDSVKTEIDKDMYSVPNTAIYEAEAVDAEDAVNTETGEVTE